MIREFVLRIISFALLSGVSLFVVAGPALAQESPDTHASETNTDAATSETGDIVVTARRREESVQDVPLVVNAVTSQSLEKLNIRDFKDVQTLVPGLQLQPAADGVAPVATLRGVNFDSNNSGSNATVQFYLNDAVISAGFLLQTMFDVGQIEVLRGPQGTLRGIAAPSGSITVTTRKPDLREVGGYVTGTVNSIGGINANGAVNVPIIRDILAVRIAGIVNDDEATRVHSINNTSANPYNHGRGERVTVRFDPIDSIDIIGQYQHFLNKGQFFDQVESANLALALPVIGTQINPFDREAVQNAPRTIRQDYNVWNIQAQWKFAGQKLNYVGGWANQDIHSQYRDDQGDAFGSNFPGDASLDPIASPNLQNYGQNAHTRSMQYSHELRLSSDERLFGMVDYVIGGLINRLDSPTDLIINTPIFASSPPTPTNYFGMHPTNISLKGRSLERSIYGNVNVHLDSATEISGGLRYIHFNHTSSLLATPFDDHHTIYSASIKHRFNDKVMAYATTGSSYRASAGTNGIILASTGNTGYSDPNLAAMLGAFAEKSRSYEVGVKTDWMEKRLHANLSYYHQDFDDYIFSSPIVAIQNLNAQTGVYTPSLTRSGLGVGVPVKVNGVEGEVAFQLDEHFNMGAQISYSLGRVTNGQVPCGTTPPTPPQQVNICSVNQRAGLTSPFQASAQAEYTRQAFGQADGFIRGQLSYYGHSQNDPTNPYDDVKAYGLVNLFLGLRDHNGAWEVNAYAKNLFDTQRVLSRIASPYLTGYATFTGGNAVVTNYRGITVTQPREFGLTASFSFGSH
jgi:iron complex outermembrane receptor protein